MMPAAVMSRKDKLTLALLVSMSVFLFADQRIMSAIIGELSVEYGVSEYTLGIIGSAFTLMGAFCSLAFGYMADKVSRKRLILAAVLIGEIPCLLTGFEVFTRTITSFTILRILTGIGIGGIYPISFSVVSDYFSEEHRASAAAWLGVSWAIGMMLGPALAGYLTNDFGWRIAFIIVALPNFPIALLFARVAEEPERGKSEQALEALIQQGIAYRQRITLSDFRLILSNRTNIWTFLQGIPGTVPWGILGYWLIHFFEKNRGFSKETATTLFLMLGIGATIGAIVFAVIGEKLYRKKPAYMPMLCGGGVLIGLIPAFILVNWSHFQPGGWHQTAFFMLAFLTGFLVSVPSANVKAILMNVNRPEHRGSVFAVFNITDNLGQGFGPAIGGVLVSIGYLFTMNFAIFWWIPCGLLFFLVAKTITIDRENLQETLRNRAKEMTPGG
jgi:MFS family permease